MTPDHIHGLVIKNNNIVRPILQNKSIIMVGVDIDVMLDLCLKIKAQLWEENNAFQPTHPR